MGLFYPKPLTNDYTVRYNDDMDNKTALLETALRLFSQRGYDAVGVQEIVDAVGVTKPTLYHYFGSKRDLLQVILEQNFTNLKKALADAAFYQGDLPQTLYKITELYFSFAKENPAFYRLQLGLWFAPQESEGYQVVTDLNRFQFEIIENLFKLSVVEHGNMRGRHQAYALTFLGMINNYIALALNGYTELSEQVARQAVHQFQHGIYS